jgi:hypothetical protein
VANLEAVESSEDEQEAQSAREAKQQKVSIQQAPNTKAAVVSQTVPRV